MERFNCSPVLSKYGNDHKFWYHLSKPKYDSLTKELTDPNRFKLNSSVNKKSVLLGKVIFYA